METCVFEEVLEKVSNDIISLSIYYFTSNLQIQCQERTNSSSKKNRGFEVKFTFTIENYGFEEVLCMSSGLYRCEGCMDDLSVVVHFLSPCL